MTDYLSKTIDSLVDRIDALIIQRRAGFEDSADQFRIALADSLGDFVSAMKEELANAFPFRLDR